jgi:hypothetical protein
MKASQEAKLCPTVAGSSVRDTLCRERSRKRRPASLPGESLDGAFGTEHELVCVTILVSKFGVGDTEFVDVQRIVGINVLLRVVCLNEENVRSAVARSQNAVKLGLVCCVLCYLIVILEAGIVCYIVLVQESLEFFVPGMITNGVVPVYYIGCRSDVSSG